MNKNLPKTLRELSGRNSTPETLEKSVILVIDAQKEYTEGALPLFEIDKSIDALAKFLNRARAKNTPIIHIVHTGGVNGKIFNPDGPFFEIIDKVKPTEGEIIIEKKFPSSFTGTTLEETLKKIGKKDLIITGYMTHMCVNSTTREATEKGYNCTIISELTTTRDLPDGKGGIISAENVKKVNLASLADSFAIVLEKPSELL
ncbi:MAG: cysteine hydrolase family protein [bacterium]